MPGDRLTLRSPHGNDAAGTAVAPTGAASAQSEAESSAAATPSWTSWRNLWQVPTIIGSVVLIVVGLKSAVVPPLSNDFDGAIEQVEQFIAEGRIDQAYAQMRGVIEPNIAKATIVQQGRFHAVSADLTCVSQETSGDRSEANSKHIVKEYGLAEECGLELSPVRIEQLGEAMLALGEFDDVQKQLDRLKAMASTPELDNSAAPTSHDSSETPANSHADAGHNGGADDHGGDEQAAQSNGSNHASADTAEVDRVASGRSYGRLFRKLIDAQIQRPDIDADTVMELLAAYRLAGPVSEADRMWVARRLAEMRIETGHADMAVNALLVEMRRLEIDAPHDQGLPFGELYLLLGRGYLELGDTASARPNLQRALDLLGPSEAARGDALVLIGRMALAAGEHDSAYEKFNAVTTEFVGTRSYLPGLLGKAECESLMGDHASSQADFREVAVQLKKSQPRRDVSRLVVAQRLCDRHDAALAMGRMDRALEYVSIAESLFAVDAVPADVLIRLASTNRQMAENLLASAGEVTGQAEQTTSIDDIDPAVRYEANRRFVQAAEDYIRHVAAETTQPMSEAEWGDSLWAAAECFDQGGEHRRAIEQFEKYLGSRPPDDSRKAEAMFRLAQAHQALMEYGEAAAAYELLLSDRTRSSFAARCHVPLARCYLALNRTDEARKTLDRVLTGESLLQPDANDYRDALIELGRLHHDQGEHVAAIERLTEAMERYPDDSRSAEIRYLLADSFRGNAQAIGQRLAEDTGLSPAENSRLASLRNEHLQRAEEIFGSIVIEHAPQPGKTIAASVEDLVRRAHLYQADCAFELGQFEHAVELYESASRQYSAGASSMYALVQIVNCYSALGDVERASAAHQRALLRLKQLPDTAFASPDSLMDRTAWERWLRNSPVGGDTITAAAPTSG